MLIGAPAFGAVAASLDYAGGYALASAMLGGVVLIGVSLDLRLARGRTG